MKQVLPELIRPEGLHRLLTLFFKSFSDNDESPINDEEVARYAAAVAATATPATVAPVNR